MGLKEYIFGHLAEKLVAKFLVKNGFKIEAMNFRSKYGEIDIIASKGDVLHFVEVKATSKNHHTIERVTKSKLNKMIKTINYYMLQNRLTKNYQIDVAGVQDGDVSLIENISF